jgi:hypothetical protein
MGNNVSTSNVAKGNDELFLLITADEQLSDTNRCSSSESDNSSCESYTEFPEVSSSVQNKQNHQPKTSWDNNSTHHCFFLPTMLQKRQNPLRLVHDDTDRPITNVLEELDGDENPDNGVPSKFSSTSSCWPQTMFTTTATMGRRSSYRQRNGNYKSTCIDSFSRMRDSKLPVDYRLDFENDSSPSNDDDDDDDENAAVEDHTCSPADYLYPKWSNNNNNKASTISNASLPSSSALETSTRRFYYCYPSGPSSSTSSLSKCKNAMSFTAASIPLFLDERSNSNNNSSNWEYTQEELDMVDGDEPTEASNLQPPRRYWIVTTAALPWMTGTAVNPLLRAAYLSQRNRQLMQQQFQKQQEKDRPELDDDDDDDNVEEDTKRIPSTVTLVLPWLEDPGDREKLYGPAWAAPDKTCDDQEAFIRQWLSKSAFLPQEAAHPSRGGIAIQWYPARYHAALSSIFALGDLCEMIPEDGDGCSPNSFGSTKSDMICILEEPEHVNFYRAPGRESWRDRFGHVIGVVHTNYKAYARNHYSGLLTGPLVGALSSLMVRAYCDKVVKLSAVLQSYAPGKEVISNVHGIRQEFFRVPVAPQKSNSGRAQCYFIGKLLWGEFNRCNSKILLGWIVLS